MAIFTLIRSWLVAILTSPYHFLQRILSREREIKFEVEPQKEEVQRMPTFYHDDENWADVTPIPQDDGSLHPLAAIAYTEEYSEAMSYLRAVMAKSEFSERVLGLTEHIISMNPAHYTVW